MKSLLTILLITMASWTVSGQFVAMEQEGYQKVFYIGLKNYITIAAENCPCKSLLVTASEGKISGDSCQYVYETDTAANYSKENLKSTEIKVFKKIGSKLILLQNWFIQLRFVPDPIALFSGSEKDDTVREVRMLWASNATVLRSEVQYFPLNISFRVQNFKVSIVRGDSTILSEFTNNGNWFRKELLKEFEKLKIGDKVCFHDIYTKGTDGTHRLIKPLTLFISEFISEQGIGK